MLVYERIGVSDGAILVTQKSVCFVTTGMI